MSRWISLVLAFVVWIAPARGQLNTPEYVAEFQRGVAALSAGKLDDGIAIFKKLYARNPSDSMCAYNVACGYAKKGEIEPAFEYLTQAVDKGFGNMDSPDGVNHADFIGTDTDLAPLRKDPRYVALVEKMRTLRKSAEEYAAQPAIYVPAAVASLAEIPVLVVCHENGETKDRVIAGPWKQIADELGFALIAPSGRFPMRGDPKQGVAWFQEVVVYAADPARYQRSVNAAYELFKKDHKVDRTRVLIAGEGAGALVASSVAVSSPGTYKGALMLESVLVPQLLAERAPAAAKQGLRMRFMNDPKRLKSALEAAEPASDTLATWNKALRGWGISGSAEEYDLEGLGENGRNQIIVATLRELSKPPMVPIDAAAAQRGEGEKVPEPPK